LQLRERIPNPQVDLVPIVEPGAFQLPVLQGEPERSYQVQRRFCGQTEAADVARVWRNLGFN